MEAEAGRMEKSNLSGCSTHCTYCRILDKHQGRLCSRWSPDSRSSYDGCHMIGSSNMPFPSNMTLWHPRGSIDDPQWSLTALTSGPTRVRAACLCCNRRERSRFRGLRCSAGVSQFSRRAWDPVGQLSRFHVAKYGTEKKKSTHLVYYIQEINERV